MNTYKHTKGNLCKMIRGPGSMPANRGKRARRLKEQLCRRKSKDKPKPILVLLRSNQCRPTAHRQHALFIFPHKLQYSSKLDGDMRLNNPCICSTAGSNRRQPELSNKTHNYLLSGTAARSEESGSRYRCGTVRNAPGLSCDRHELVCHGKEDSFSFCHMGVMWSKLR